MVISETFSYKKILDANFDVEPLEIVRCKYEHFNYPRKNESAYGDVSNLWCIKDKSKMKLGGAWVN